MKRVIIDLDENYDDVITFTAVGTSAFKTRVTTWAMDLHEQTYAAIDKDGIMQTERIDG